MAYIRRQGLPHILGQGKPVVPDALAPDADLALFPVDVVQLQVRHLSGTQAEPRQDEQDRIIGSPTGSPQERLDRRRRAPAEVTLGVLTAATWPPWERKRIGLGQCLLAGRENERSCEGQLSRSGHSPYAHGVA